MLDRDRLPHIIDGYRVSATPILSDDEWENPAHTIVLTPMPGMSDPSSYERSYGDWFGTPAEMAFDLASIVTQGGGYRSPWQRSRNTLWLGFKVRHDRRHDGMLLPRRRVYRAWRKAMRQHFPVCAACHGFNECHPGALQGGVSRAQQEDTPCCAYDPRTAVQKHHYEKERDDHA